MRAENLTPRREVAKVRKRGEETERFLDSRERRLALVGVWSVVRGWALVGVAWGGAGLGGRVGAWGGRLCERRCLCGCRGPRGLVRLGCRIGARGLTGL